MLDFERYILPKPNSGCWLWTGPVSERGYGYYKGKRAHRYAFNLYRGEIPDGLTLDHLCRVRCCVNPNHLDPCTAVENIRRGERAKSKITHCPKGHEYTPENTRWYDNERQCRQCHRDYVSRYQKRKYAEGFTKVNGKWAKRDSPALS